MEIWKDVPDLIGYQASTYSRIKRLKCTSKFMRNGVVNTIHKKELILKETISSNGYYTISIYKIGNVLLHRILGTTFIDNPYNKKTINHKNGIKTDNRLKNLEWNTYSENNKHAFDTGLKKKGEDIYNAKLSKLDVENIRKQYNCETITQQKLADKYNVSIGNINGIVNFNRWI